MKRSWSPRRKHFVIFLFIIILGATAVLGRKIAIAIRELRPAAGCFHCNVVLLDMDIVRAQELPCLGYTRNTMPNLCRFAKDNILFSQAHAQSTWTFPNQVSLFTSLYPSNHGMDDPLHDTLHPSIATLTDRYKKAGYKTIFIGNSRDENLQLRGGLGRSFDTIIDTHDMTMDDQMRQWQQAIYTIEARNFLDPPVFLYLYTEYVGNYRGADIGFVTHFVFDPSFVVPALPNLNVFTSQTIADTKEHIRYNIYRKTGLSTTAEYESILGKLDQATTLQEAQQAFSRLDPYEQHLIYSLQIHRRLDMTNPAHRAYVQNIYDNRLVELDGKLQPILAAFEKQPLAQNTIIALFSDHGENLGDHGLLGHATEPFDTVTHVPLILRIPEARPQTIHTITQLVDIYPTLLHLTGLPASTTKLAGTDLSPLVWGQAPPSEENFAIAEVNKAMDQSIRTNTWRLVIIRSTNPPQTKLYNLQIDPQETHNVAREYPEVVNMLQKQLDATITSIPSYPR